jgi:superfamily II DNA or RNA helicase
MPTFDEFYASMNPDSGTRGNEFERKFVPWFLQTDPGWKSQIDHLWLWKDYPHRWGRDCGIDLVFRDTNGKDWAVQAKCLNPDSYITKKHIDSFFSESSDRHIHGRLLIATTDRIGHNARQLIERQEKQVVLFLLDNFRKSEVEFPASIQTLLQGKRKAPRKPKPHQKRAIHEVVSGLADATRGQLIMACGTGKTLTSLWVKEKLECAVTLVLVPSLNLLSQTLREWTANARIQFKWLCVCSDATVANQDDEWVTHTSDICVPVTGEVKEIKSFLRAGGSKVIFSTYQSSPLIAEAQKDRQIPAFDLVLADEAHRCAGKVSEAFGCVLDPKRIRSGKLLFMTATPRILSQQTKSAAGGMDVEVFSMDDPAVFGNVLHELKFSQAIEEGLLSDYRVVINVVDDPLVKSKIQNRDLLRTSNGIELDAQTLATHVALAKATKQHDLRRVISFHGRVSEAKQFAADHTEVLGWIRKADRPSGTTTADYVSGDMSSGDRSTKLSRLRHLEADERGILCNARCLSEGVDVPSLDGVAFISPRRSQVDIVQAVGRAIRKSEGKTHGTIVIPVFIEEGESEHEALESSRFKPIWDVVNALRSHDDALAHDLDQLRTSLGRRGVIDGGGLRKIVFDLPAICGKSFAGALRTRLVEQTTASWMFWYGLLQEHVKNTGTARMRQHFKTKDGFKLGRWAGDQRRNKDVLSADRRKLLESCKGWCWDVFADKWHHGLEELKKYVALHGSLRVSAGFKTSHGKDLRFWVFNQRRKKESLTSEQVRLLESVDGWTWEPVDRWDEAFAKLFQYAETTGSTSVPGGFKTADGFNLGAWVTAQRGSKASLSNKQRKLLESCNGWSWDPIADQWDEAFQRLKQYVETHGSAFVPQRFKTEDGFSLGSWVSNQRHRRDVLSVGQKH